MLMNYLISLFGKESITESFISLESLPYYLIDYYDYKKISIYNKDYVFVKPIGDFNLKSYRTHLHKIEEYLSLPVVLCIDRLSFYQVKILIEFKIEFVEPDRQLFLPSLAIVLNQKRQKEPNRTNIQFTPQTQLCALFFLYNPIREYSSLEISNAIKLNPMAVSRGVITLTELNLLTKTTYGRSNSYILKPGKRDYLLSLKERCISPIAKRFVLSTQYIFKKKLYSGFSALSNYTSIVDNNNKTYAIDKSTYNRIKKDIIIQSNPIREDDYYIEVWNYNPYIFAKDYNVDKFSLYLSFDEKYDERTKESLNELFAEIVND